MLSLRTMRKLLVEVRAVPHEKAVNDGPKSEVAA
jgi:hypothetical protein